MLAKRHRCNDGAEENEEEASAEEYVAVIRENVYYYAPVEQKYVLRLIRALDEASEHALKTSTYPSDARVYLYIHSCGGDAYAGMSAMDHIRNSRVNVVTVADGYVASAATFMLLGGQERKMMRNAKVLIHQLSTVFWGKYAELLDEMENSKELMDTIGQLYTANLTMPKSELDKLLKKEVHMNATQCVSCGMVDEIW